MKILIMVVRLSKVKSCFGYDKNSNKIQDFKNYVRDFYYVLCYYETFPNNIIFCGLDVYSFLF